MAGRKDHAVEGAEGRSGYGQLVTCLMQGIQSLNRTWDETGAEVRDEQTQQVNVHDDST